MKPVNDILIRPVITEKATRLQDQNRYAFAVARTANRQDVREAVQKAFNVTVTKVNTVMMRGEAKMRGRWSYRRPDWKKALVTLKKGDKIQIFENV
ncbi:MAG: 50S ribosomal protein L23 [Chloroflexi bacterium]|nr:50S ribosomal protein L23 [Chloroflexota bacterium]